MKRCKLPTCGRIIPAARLEAAPRSETCSRACAVENRRLNANARNRKAYSKRKAEREA